MIDHVNKEILTMKTLLNIGIVGVLMFLMAYIFIQGWDLQYDIDQKKSAISISAGVGPSAPTGLVPNYGQSSEPKKVHTYKDPSVSISGKTRR
jgi:hypothetical protein